MVHVFYIPCTETEHVRPNYSEEVHTVQQYAPYSSVSCELHVPSHSVAQHVEQFSSNTPKEAIQHSLHQPYLCHH